ncbi:SigE family RNA polymerase sigma factor [Amycolatopsis mediterranei]|uniref:SigE family RNA polymerase sigma factor n=1 Tax=Amycolatopsis mediterranei TaxID=33910 RepID=UPI0034146D4B
MKQTDDAGTGRDAEFREFVRSRGTPLHRSAYLLCGDRHLADDVVQDTLVKAYQHWRRVRQADSPEAYVRRILLNEVRGRWRRRERSVPVAEFAGEPAVADPADDVIRRDGLRQALLTLPLRQRATVVLRYLEGLSERETAAVLGCSTGTVKSQSSRALAGLKSFFDRTETKL